MGVLRWLLGKPNRKLDYVEPRIEPPVEPLVEPPHGGVPADQQKEVSNAIDAFSFFVDGLQTEFKKFSQVGESVKLWIPKVNNPDKVYIYHRDGPGGCLGTVPSTYSNIIISHLKNTLEYEAEIEALTENQCKLKCRLISKKETKRRKEEKKATIRKELTKAYGAKNPITLMLATSRRNAVKAGDKLVMEFNDLDSYVQAVSTQRGPYSSQWHINFLNQTGEIIGILDHDKSIIQRILKAHFNSYLFNIEVLDTFAHLDYSEEKKRSNWKGYPIKLLITPYKGTDPTSS